MHAFKRQPKFIQWSPDKLNVVNADAFLDGTTFFESFSVS